jgi:hypothetical protein
MAQQPQYGQQPQGYYGDKQNMSQQQLPPQQQHQQQHQQPVTAYEHAHKLPNKWQFGLFDCFSPFGTCRSRPVLIADLSDMSQAVFLAGAHAFSMARSMLESGVSGTRVA